jgi:hypothetical protein
MKRAVVLMILPAGLILATLTFYAGAQPQRAETTFKPEAPLHDLMELNDVMNDSLRVHLGSSPDFTAAAHNARIMGEIANVLHFHKSPDVADWWQWASDFRDGSRKVVAAIEQKDLQAARTALKGMYTSCKECHNKYKPE